MANITFFCPVREKGCALGLNAAGGRVDLGAAALSLAFLVPLVGSVSRPWGNGLADRSGGAPVTATVFAVVALRALAVVVILPLAGFCPFLGLFLLLFTAAGTGNGSAYRMIPSVCRVLGLRHERHIPVSTERKASAALGLIGGIGPYGGFLAPQALNLSSSTTGAYSAAFYAFVGFYAPAVLVTWFCCLRQGTEMGGSQV